MKPLYRIPALLAVIFLALCAAGCPKTAPKPEASPASVKRTILKTAHKAEVGLDTTFESIENAARAGLIDVPHERASIVAIQVASDKVRAVNAKADAIDPLFLTSAQRDDLVKDWDEILNLLDDPALLELANVKNPQSKVAIGALIKGVKDLGGEIVDTLKRLEVGQ